MIEVANAPFGLKQQSSMLTRRGGTDADAHQRLQTAILRDWHVGIPPPIWEISENCPKRSPLTNTQFINAGPGLAEVS